MQFGFMPSRSTIDAIFIARQLQQRYLGNKKKLYFSFVDLENPSIEFQEQLLGGL